MPDTSASLIQIDPEISMGLFNREGLQQALTIEPVRSGAGVAILLGGPSKSDPSKIAQTFNDVTEVRFVGGMPLGQAYEALIDWTNRAVLVVMGPSFDRRHGQYLSSQLMANVAARRGLKPSAAAATALQRNDVPAGDLARMDEAVANVVRQLDALLQYPIVGTTH